MGASCIVVKEGGRNYSAERNVSDTKRKQSRTTNQAGTDYFANLNVPLLHKRHKCAIGGMNSITIEVAFCDHPHPYMSSCDVCLATKDSVVSWSCDSLLQECGGLDISCRSEDVIFSKTCHLHDLLHDIRDFPGPWLIFCRGVSIYL